VSSPLLDLGGGAEVRILEPDDAGEVWRLVDGERERLRRWMPWVDGTTGPGDTGAFIAHARACDELDGLGIFVDGAYVGGIGLRVDAGRRDGEIGYWIGADHEGRGLVTRASRGLIGHAFGPLGLHRVTIRVGPENTRSRAIPERLGFTEEGRMREAGRGGDGPYDLVVYGLLVGEWSRAP